MKAINYLYCVLLFACLVHVAYFEKVQSKIDQQFPDSIVTDESMKMKRPFCNAFTGCGRKRNFHENPSDSQELEASGIVRLPLSVYKALLRAATQNIRNTIERDTIDYQLSGTPQVYLSGRMPLHKRFDIPPAPLDSFEGFRD